MSKFFKGDLVRIINDDEWMEAVKGFQCIVETVSDNDPSYSLSIGAWWPEECLELVEENFGFRRWEKVKDSINAHLPREQKTTESHKQFMKNNPDWGKGLNEAYAKELAKAILEMPLAQAAEEAGLDYGSLLKRVKYQGITVEEALDRSNKYKNRHNAKK